MSSLLIRLLAMGVLFGSLMSCDSSTVYEHHVELPESGWAYADSVKFSFTISDTEKDYDLMLDIDHTEDFPYENFYVKIYTLLPNHSRNEQQVSLQMAGDYGKWLGNCSNGSCSLSIPVLSNTHFTSTEEYGLMIEQFSRDNPLPEIKSVGLRIVVSD